MFINNGSLIKKTTVLFFPRFIEQNANYVNQKLNLLLWRFYSSSSFSRSDRCEPLSFASRILDWADTKRFGILRNWTGSFSMLTQFRLERKQATAAVPDPEQRSRTLSLGTVKYSIKRWIRRQGFWHGFNTEVAPPSISQYTFFLQTLNWKRLEVDSSAVMLNNARCLLAGLIPGPLTTNHAMTINSMS